jgi:hypothetical protein
MKRDVIVFTLLAAILWYWIMLLLVAVFAPGIIYPTMYFRGIPLLRAFVFGTPFAFALGLCPAIAAGALIAGWTKYTSQLTFLKVLAVGSGISLNMAMIAWLPLSSDPSRMILIPLSVIAFCTLLTITMSWLIVQSMKHLMAFTSRLVTRGKA